MFARSFLALVLAVSLGLSGSARAEAPKDDRLLYEVLYDVRLVPTERAAHVKVVLGKNAERVKWLRFALDPARHLMIKADGELEVRGSTAEWRPPKEGGRLEYVFRIDHLRDARRYDARCAENWALFRGDDLVPPVHTRTTKDARAIAKMRLRLPDGWKAAVPFAKEDDGTYRIKRDRHGFDRPTGWFLVGKIGISRSRIAGMKVTVASPKKSSFRRQDILAFLRFTLPALKDLVGELPEHLLIVGGGDPMWRGGLSGPGSVYVHADRPLIENDMTSPVLHEILHSIMGARSKGDGDWVVEGLAELYSLEVLVRSKAISKMRYRRAFDKLQEKGKEVTSLRVPKADGKVTARAVGVLKALDEEIRERSEGAKSLDDVLRFLVVKQDAIDTDGFRQIAEGVTGLDLADFFERNVKALPLAPAEKVSRPLLPRPE